MLDEAVIREWTCGVNTDGMELVLNVSIKQAARATVLTQALVDSRATGFFIDHSFIESHRLKKIPLKYPIRVINSDKSENSLGVITHYVKTELDVPTTPSPISTIRRKRISKMLTAKSLRRRTRSRPSRQPLKQNRTVLPHMSFLGAPSPSPSGWLRRGRICRTT